MLIIIILGLLLGNLLYFFDKKRGYRRSLMTSIASLFGESGYLSERWGGRDGFLEEKYEKFSGLPMITLIFVISYFSLWECNYTTAFQAVSLSNIDKLTYDDISGKTFVLPEGYSDAMGDSIKRLGEKSLEVKEKLLIYIQISKKINMMV